MLQDTVTGLRHLASTVRPRTAYRVPQDRTPQDRVLQDHLPLLQRQRAATARPSAATTTPRTARPPAATARPSAATTRPSAATARPRTAGPHAARLHAAPAIDRVLQDWSTTG